MISVDKACHKVYDGIMLTFENAPDVLTIDEVAQLLRIDTQTVKRYIKDHKIIATHLTVHTIRILKSNLLFLFKAPGYKGLKEL